MLHRNITEILTIISPICVCVTQRMNIHTKKIAYASLPNVNSSLFPLITMESFQL